MKILLLLSPALLVAGCGEKVSTHLEYEPEGDAVTITDCNDGASGKLVIPATIEDTPSPASGIRPSLDAPA